jgi:acyl carrier protein phosphodiesterase
LAKNWHNYSFIPLEEYVSQFYKSLVTNEIVLTEKTKNLLPYMIKNNWLLSYRSIDGIEKILYQMDYRTKHRANMQEAVAELKLFYAEFEEEFTVFFEDLRGFVRDLSS